MKARIGKESGFTLLEALLSAALLSMLAVSVVPLLRDLRGSPPRAEFFSSDDLSRAADALLADGEVKSRLDSMLIGESLEFDGPVNVERKTSNRRESDLAPPSIRVTRVASVSPHREDGAWWIFSARSEADGSPDPRFTLRFGKINSDGKGAAR